MLRKFFLLVFLLSLLGACSQMRDETDKIEEEPIINVRLSDGQIKKIKIEEYIEGVVAGEMKKGWHQNAYAAQAIIARTFAMKRLKENGDNTISAKHEDAQAYRPENITQEIKAAVKKTRGEVAMFQGEYIKGWFHSSAGGETTSAKVGLAYKEEEPQYLKSIKSPDDKAPAEIKDWAVNITDNEIVKALKKAAEIANKIQNIKILDKDETGRIVELEIFHDKGSKRLAGAEFRTLIGPDRLKSTMVKSLVRQANNFLLKGSGYGHGVGMSQWGAYQMAEEGTSPEDIIKYYFKNVKIEKIWD